MARGKVLVVEDEMDVAHFIESYLAREGYEVFFAHDGEQVLEKLDRHAPDVLVLDIMLPHVDGLTLCREIRRTRNLPILMVSARNDDVDKILGLELGADDYLAKPFNPKELVARVRALFRRLQMVGPGDEGILACGVLKIDVAAQKAEVDSKALNLTPLEFTLLKALATHRGRVLTRQDLLNIGWGPEFVGDERNVDVHLGRVRQKMQKVGGVQYIHAVWGVGYKLEI
jgi:DNA-binding response OmpR family regulator